ncbi:translocation/assembly module TamB domain-containing protein [Pontibacter sp. JH31]|uniref:Translocation/assembly module TamB domain-containing protein n=1 Tax=Pontibacter aquaedesilientis TaxID=2766980 RepID=A0ABR7XGG3_9BACT|nr:translocation/assembly module TamB domain-containing protein [Pontibacter aquaedesilientis]MBD1396491.1 translocation/assembly module TamB domain-containing protein [Pontibacter aquaedesilientis]
MLWFLAIVVGILLIVIVALQFPKVQHFAAQKGASYLSGMLDTKVEIGGFTTDWRNTVVLKQVYLEDQQQDTLWYSDRLGLDIRIWSLISGEVNISKIDLQQATLNLHIRPDSSSNFDFLAEAFATDTITAQPADTAAMNISLGVINLENVYVNFRDELGGNLIRGRVGKLLTTMEELNLEKEIYRLDRIELQNTGIQYVQTKLPPESESEPITFDFGLNGVALENFNLSFKSIPANQRIELQLGKSELEAEDIDLPNARIDLKSFDLHNSKVLYVQEKYKPTDSLAVNPAETVRKLDESVEKTQGQEVKWVLTLGKLNVSGLQAGMDNADAPRLASGMDYNHLKFSNIEIDAEDIRYSLNRMGMQLNQLKLEEQSGFRVNNFQAAITLDSTHARLADLDLKTGHSHIRKDLAMRYTSWSDLTDNLDAVRLELDIDNSRIGMQDVLYFAPDLAKNPSFKKIASSTLRLDGRARGRMDNLNIPRLQVAGLQGTAVDVSGTVRNAQDPDRLYLDLDINQLVTTRTDILALSPPGTLPPEIRIPNKLRMTGNYKGSLTNFDARADISSSFGNINAVVDMGQAPAGAEPFKATVKTNGFDLGQLFTEDYGIGKVAFEATANGTGLTPETMRANVKARIREASYNNYTYNNVVVDANIDRNLYRVAAQSRDENLNFDLKGDFNLRDSNRGVYTFDMDLKGVDLKALNLYEDELGLRGHLRGKFTGKDMSDMSGTLEGEKVFVRHQQVSYPVDSLQLTLNQQVKGTEVILNSGVLAANMRFANDLATLPTALQKHFSNYFDLHPDPPYPANLNLGDFNVKLQVRRPDIIASFVPGLERMQVQGPITASYNQQTQAFNMDAKLSQLTYTGYNLSDLGLRVRGDRQQLGYKLAVREIKSSSLQLRNVSLDGAARDNDMTMRLAMLENDSTERFVVGGLLNSLGKGYRFSFNPEQLVINGQPWTVPQDNYLQFDSNLLYANNIRLERNGSYLLLNSTGPVRATAPLQVEFGNFEIGYIMESFQQQDSVLTGVIDGTATLTNLMAGSPAFTSDLTVTNLAYTGISVGNIALKANSAGGNRYNLDLSLTGNGNQVLVNGFYEAQPNASLLNLDANISNLNMASLGGFTQGMVDDLAGNANGKLRITGTLEQPNVRGSLAFNQAQFNLTMLNSVFTLQDERLEFTERGISMQNFTLTDSLGNNLELNGDILTQNYIDYTFALKANTDRFLAMNSTALDNDLFYGTVLIAADADITGSMMEPTIDVRVRVLDNSTFTTVIPADEVAAAEREGVVEFVSLSDSLDAVLADNEVVETTTGFVGANVEAQITVTDATTITIVIDPTTGDNLVVRGNASPLYIGITPSGQMNMSGRYEITEGRYSMDFYDLVSRELSIGKGSYIAWTGDPMMADIQIAAIYNVQAAPLELVESQTGNMEQAAMSRYRTQLPFEVFVNISGEMLKPAIGFDIQLEEQRRGALDGDVESRLVALRQDENELSKQVFALLVLNRFLAPDPLASTGGGLGATARNSLSQVMSDQLNQLTNRYAGGLGLELGVSSYEDYSSGSAEGRTDLNVAMRQQFLNDRLTVRVGTDIGLEGQRESQQNMSGFGGDVSVEYSITTDGRLRVRGFQRNQYEGFLEGDVRATGLALIFVRDYDNFSDLFRNLERREARKAERRLVQAAKLSEKEKRKQEIEAAEEVQEIKQQD